MHTIEKCDVYGGLAFFQKFIVSKFMRVSFRRKSFDYYYVKNLFRVTYHLKDWQRQNAGEKGKGKKREKKIGEGCGCTKMERKNGVVRGTRIGLSSFSLMALFSPSSL